MGEAFANFAKAFQGIVAWIRGVWYEQQSQQFGMQVI